MLGLFKVADGEVKEDRTKLCVAESSPAGSMNDSPLGSRGPSRPSSRRSSIFEFLKVPICGEKLFEEPLENENTK